MAAENREWSGDNRMTCEGLGIWRLCAIVRLLYLLIIENNTAFGVLPVQYSGGVTAAEGCGGCLLVK